MKIGYTWMAKGSEEDLRAIAADFSRMFKTEFEVDDWLPEDMGVRLVVDFDDETTPEAEEFLAAAERTCTQYPDLVVTISRDYSEYSREGCRNFPLVRIIPIIYENRDLPKMQMLLGSREESELHRVLIDNEVCCRWQLGDPIVRPADPPLRIVSERGGTLPAMSIIGKVCVLFREDLWQAIRDVIIDDVTLIPVDGRDDVFAVWPTTNVGSPLGEPGEICAVCGAYDLVAWPEEEMLPTFEYAVVGDRQLIVCWPWTEQVVFGARAFAVLEEHEVEIVAFTPCAMRRSLNSQHSRK